MKAKNMFKRIGYSLKYKNKEDIVYNLYDYNIGFDKRDRYIKIWNTDKSEFTFLSLGEIEAINKQIEELGWKKNDDENG